MVCIHPQDNPQVNMYLWLRGRKVEESMEFSIHSTHATLESRGSYAKHTCEKVKDALDNWLKEN